LDVVQAISLSASDEMWIMQERRQSSASKEDYDVLTIYNASKMAMARKESPASHAVIGEWDNMLLPNNYCKTTISIFIHLTMHLRMNELGQKISCYEPMKIRWDQAHLKTQRENKLKIIGGESFSDEWNSSCHLSFFFLVDIVDRLTLRVNKPEEIEYSFKSYGFRLATFVSFLSQMSKLME
jgi:hypothetical protein